jgi:hypothetical protein
MNAIASSSFLGVLADQNSWSDSLKRNFIDSQILMSKE